MKTVGFGEVVEALFHLPSCNNCCDYVIQAKTTKFSVFCLQTQTARRPDFDLNT